MNGISAFRSSFSCKKKENNLYGTKNRPGMAIWLSGLSAFIVVLQMPFPAVNTRVMTLSLGLVMLLQAGFPIAAGSSDHDIFLLYLIKYNVKSIYFFIKFGLYRGNGKKEKRGVGALLLNFC